MANKQDIIFTLAQYFTGPAVAVNSTLLQAGPQLKSAAGQFFEARTALGLCGYPTMEEAIETIGGSLK